MDVFDEEFLKFWKALNNNNVRYIMVGGYATILHGYARLTSDIDIWIDDTKENRLQLKAAFKEAEMGDFPMLETIQIIPGWSDFKLNNGMKLDLLIKMKGLENFSFDESLNLATIAEIDGVLVPFLHLNQLIVNKKAVNRPKDQIDVIELEKIKQIRDSENKEE